ncbi:hypothetical protein PO124_22570 [Bacillus licheniformis]|nr:hypothetical protein [Bacillus licheniformis]
MKNISVSFSLSTSFATITPSFASAKEEGEIDAPAGSLESELLSPDSDLLNS